MAYEWYGDINPENGGLFLDLEELENNGDYCLAIKITGLDSAIGFQGAVMIERGAIYIPKDSKKRQDALDCIGIQRADATPLNLAEAFDAYSGIDIDCYNGRITIQTELEGAMEFDGWKADKKLSGESLKDYIESKYGVTF